MTEKRFSLRYIGEQHLSTNLYDDKIFIGSIGIGAELVVDLLNDLSEENKQLKQQNNDLIKLINDLGSEEMDRQMEEILND